MHRKGAGLPSAGDSSAGGDPRRGRLRQGRHLRPQLHHRPQRRNPNPPRPLSPHGNPSHHRQQPHVHNRLDDPLMRGFKGFPITDATLARWVLAAEDICFKNAAFSYFFRLGKCIPVVRGGGIYQERMKEALDLLNSGCWLHTFPEGKISQEHGPIRRLKWGTASLIARARLTPIVLPIVHSGFEKVMPEHSFFGRRPPVPLCANDVKIVVGEPMQFDLPKLKERAISESRGFSFQPFGWPISSLLGLDEAAQRWLYIHISDEIREYMERLKCFGSSSKITSEAKV